MPRGVKKEIAWQEPGVSTPRKATRRTSVAKTTKSADEMEALRTKTIVKDTLVPVVNDPAIRREVAYDASDLGWTPGKFPASLKHNGTTYTKDAAHTQPASKIVAYVNYVKRDRKGDLVEIIPVFNA